MATYNVCKILLKRTTNLSNSMRKILITVLVITSSLLLSDCSQDDIEKPSVARIVVTAPVNSVDITTTSTLQLSAIAQDKSGKAVEGIVFSWKISNELVATVDGNGLISLITTGQVIVEASANGITGSKSINITRPPTLEEFVQAQMTSNGIKALAACIVKDGEISWIKGFGKHQDGSDAPTTDESLFITFSLAKLIVGVSVMQQVELGNINLDEDLSTYFGFTFKNPNHPAKKLTPRLLLTHQTGLNHPTFEESNDMNLIFEDSLFTLESWVQNYLVPGNPKYTATLWSNIEPGTTHQNSNVGVAVLARLVEIVAGKDFRTYAKDHVFSPLGMTNTGYYPSKPDGFPEELIVDGLTSGGTQFLRFFDGAIYPGLYMRSSVKDWSKFLLAIINGGIYNNNRILNESTVDEMLDIKFPNANLAFNSGIGLMWRAFGPNKDWLGHTGAGAMLSISEIHRSKKAAVIIFCNSRTAQTVVMPGGTIYERLHQEALK